jgi:uncharacterized protein (DUF4415 family)
MNVRRITKRSFRPKQAARNTNRNRLAALSDGQIERAVRSDHDAPPIADPDWFRKAKVVLPGPKKAVSIRLDQDVMEWFRRQGRGYQTRINAVLQAYVKAQQ